VLVGVALHLNQLSYVLLDSRFIELCSPNITASIPPRIMKEESGKKVFHPQIKRPNSRNCWNKQLLNSSLRNQKNRQIMGSVVQSVRFKERL